MRYIVTIKIKEDPTHSLKKKYSFVDYDKQHKGVEQLISLLLSERITFEVVFEEFNLGGE